MNALFLLITALATALAPAAESRSIDTIAADALPSGTWTLENVASLYGAYGSNFTVVGFTNSASEVKYTFPGGPAYSTENFARLKVTGP